MRRRGRCVQVVESARTDGASQHGPVRSLCPQAIRCRLAATLSSRPPVDDLGAEQLDEQRTAEAQDVLDPGGAVSGR